MPLNKQRGNMYPWVTHTWNPIRGCLHGCIYCYVKSMPSYNSKPRLVEKELKCNLGEGNTIFIGSSSDMFGWWVPDKWIEKVLTHTQEFDNTYFFQSKNPSRFAEFAKLFPPETLLGTTIETNRGMKLSVAPDIHERIGGLQPLSLGTHHLTDRQFNTFVSIEPIMDFDLDWFVASIRIIKPKFVSVGADSKHHGLPEPSPEKIGKLLLALEGFTEVRIKNNLWRLLQ